jgi:hypothetical protein
MTLRTVFGLLALSTAMVFVGAGPAVAQMPNPRRMSGVPLPVGEMPVGTVTVRVIRGSFTNPVSSQTVELFGASEPQRATTNDIGRAEFTGLKPGTRVKATAVVGGERLESQEFAVPAAGGIRLILVAAEPDTAQAAPAPTPPGSPAGAAAAQPESIALGDESRFVFEMGEDGLSVFYILQVVNSAPTPVQPDAPIVFDLPANARGATVLQGSSPQATVSGRQMKIVGPFAPGPTIAQLAYTMPYAGPTLTIEQKLPLALAHVAVVAQAIGDLKLASPQVSEQRTMPAQGNLYIAGRGGPVPAGNVLKFDFSGLPHHPTWPRNLAIGLALLILGCGAWFAIGGADRREAETAERRQIESERDRLFDELAALEARNREQAIDPERYAERRRELVAALEGVYLALDDDVAVSRAS